MRIKKVSQSSGLIANVSNTQSNSQTDTYSCDYINGVVGKVLYDRTGNEGSNYNMPDGIMGTQSLAIDLSSYKRIQVLGFVNTRAYQFSLLIDLTDGLNTFNDNNKYWGRALIMDNSLDITANIFDVECSVTQNKQTFIAENISFRYLSDVGTINTRNLRNEYIVTKIIGYK